MKRRTLLCTLAAATASTPMPAWTQDSGGPPRIGFLYFGSKESAIKTGRYEAFIDGMRKLGYTAGQNFSLEERFAAGDSALMRAQIADLTKLNVKLLVITGTQAVHEALRMSGGVPIVATVTSDPVGQGLAKTLARPGGNVTGLYDSSIELLGKQLELLRLVLPNLSSIGVLLHPGNPTHPDRLKRLQEQAVSLQVRVQPYPSASQAEIDAAFDRMVRGKIQALLVLADTFFVQQARHIAQLAIKHRLPSIALTRDFAEAGGLLSYGEDVVDNFRLAAAYVDKILKGAAPGDLPFARSSRIEMTGNNATFRALGLKPPSEIALRADRWIE